MSSPAATRKVAYLALEKPREGVAGYVHVTEIIEGLRRRGWSVELFSLGYGWDRPSLTLRIWRLLQLQWRLIARIRQFEILYVRAHPLALPVALVAKLLRRPVVHEINGLWDDVFVAYPRARLFARMISWMQTLQFKWASGLIAVTPQLKDWLARIAAPRTPPIVVIPNGANVELFSPSASSARALPDRYAVFFGGLTPWHGVQTMVDALKSADWPQGVALVVVGDGVEMHRLRAQASHDSRLVLLGRLPYQDVPGIVRNAIAGLVPIGDPLGRSAAGGLAPLKLYETLACGVPAIVTDLPFQAEFVRDGNCGLVVPTDDGPALARAVAQLAADPANARAMGERGRALVAAEHSWDRRAGDTAQFISGFVL